MLKPKESWAVVLIWRDGTEQIEIDGGCICQWNDRKPAQDVLERKREGMRECRKLAKKRGGEHGYERIRGYRLARLRVVEIPNEKGRRKNGRKRTADA
jgi:hypothetical protein